MLYGLGVSFRNLMYRIGALKSVEFDVPVISVGNMSVGGTGKTPHIEYLIRWLDTYINIGVLSRGYGRKTIGFREVQVSDQAEATGDEPLQFKRKFPDTAVTVSESRALGIPQMLRLYPHTQCVLLDDAYQHRAVRPGLNILLTEYARPFYKDWLLPSGRLREWRSGYQRADMIIVTKCPVDMTAEQRTAMIQKINPYPRQKVFFSFYEYGTPWSLTLPTVAAPLTPGTDVLLLSAIANTDYLMSYLKRNVRSIHTVEHEDHHFFDEADMLDLKRRFRELPAGQRVVVTTEKDATRLDAWRDFLIKNDIQVVVLPVEVRFFGTDEAAFQTEVKHFLTDFKA